MHRFPIVLPALAVILALGIPTTARASTFYWAATLNSSSLQGLATFSVATDAISGFDLVIQLTNTATVYPPSTANMLTSLMFNITAGNPGTGLTLISATAPNGLLSGTTSPQTTADPNSAGATICGPAQALSSCASTVKNGWEAAYSSTGFTNWAAGTQYGIGTAGQGIFKAGVGHGQGQVDYAIAPGVGIVDSGGVYKDAPYTFDTAIFVLQGLKTSNVTITNVLAGYGTGPQAAPAGTTYAPGAPEPASSLLLLGGIVLLVVSGRTARHWMPSRRRHIADSSR